MKVTWPEAYAWVDLVAEFFRRHQRDPNDEECEELVKTAKDLVASGSGSKGVH